MNHTPKIITIESKKLVGYSREMSLANNKNQELFSGFMSNRNKIQNALGNDVYEVMIYNERYFKGFSPTNTFTKWATLEVSAYHEIPENMGMLDIMTGLYAVFHYKGLPEGFGQLMTYIMTQWLPQSKYILDNRPHFNVLGENYKNGSAESEEEVFIPLKLK